MTTLNVNVSLATLGGPIGASISRYPTGNVLPGEVITFYVTGTSGFEGSDGYEELDFRWNFGDSGGAITSESEPVERFEVGDWVTEPRLVLALGDHTGNIFEPGLHKIVLRSIT